MARCPQCREPVPLQWQLKSGIYDVYECKECGAELKQRWLYVGIVMAISLAAVAFLSAYVISTLAIASMMIRIIVVVSIALGFFIVLMTLKSYIPGSIRVVYAGNKLKKPHETDE